MRISDWSSDVCSSDLISLPDREKSLNRPRRAALQGLFPIRQGYLVGMKATIERAVLLKSLGHVQSVVERRNTIPILSNVLIEADASGQLKLMATDLDLQVVETVAAKVETADTPPPTAPTPSPHPPTPPP